MQHTTTGGRGAGSDAAAVVVVTVTAPDEAVALRIGEELVDRRLAACAQVSGPITSIYRWQDAVQRDPEWYLTLKCTAATLDDLCRVVGDLHPYDVPEVVAVAAVGGSAAYLDWVRTETATPPPG